MYRYITNASCVALLILQIHDCIGVSGNKLPKLFIYGHNRKEDGSLLQQYQSLSLINSLDLTRSANSRWGSVAKLLLIICFSHT